LPLYSSRVPRQTHTHAYIFQEMVSSNQEKVILLGILFCCQSCAFQLSPATTTLSFARRNSRLQGISEWRDSFFECPSSVNNAFNEEYHEGPIREICILPFPMEDSLLQGETKELCLYEDRFHQLFERASENHNNVVAMGLMAPPSGILQSMPLCEIESFRVMPGETAFGTSHSILATIRSVGRASLVQLQEEDERAEYLYGYCTEICDDTCSEREEVAGGKKDIILEGNRLADKLKDKMESIVELESQLELMEIVSGGEVDMSETQMKRRIIEAELFEEFEDDDDEPNRRDRLNEAFKIAKINDMQGYRISSLESTSSATSRSVQDLTALSWAYFSTEDNSVDILAHRLQALECTDLCERLRLALVMLLEKSSALKKTLRSLKSNDQDNEEA